MRNALNIFLALAILLIPAVTFAGEGKSMKEQSVAIEVGNDFYSAGGVVELKDAVDDDAYLAGAMVNVTKPVQNDVVVAGSSLTITSNIGGDIRAAGSVINLTSEVSDDAVLAGGVVNIGDAARIAGDAVIAGGMLNFAGAVDGDLKLTGDEIHFSGTVAGDTAVYVGKKITFADSARIAGKLTYFSDKEIEISSGVADSIEHKPYEDMKLTPSGELVKKSKHDVFGRLFGLLTGFVAGAALLALCGRASQTFAETVRRKFWWSILTGALAIALPLLLVILLLITVLGSMLAGILALAWILCLVASGALMGFTIGSFIIAQKKDTKYAKKLLTLALGGVLLLVLGMIPVFGPALKLVVFVLTLGAAILTERELYKGAKKAKLM